MDKKLKILGLVIATVLIGFFVIKLTARSGDGIQGKPDYTIVTDEGTYLLKNGDVYKANSDGSNSFVLKLYDPNYKDNYEEKEGKIYAKSKIGLVETKKEFEDGFEDAQNVDDLIKTDRWHAYNTDPKYQGKELNYYSKGSRLTISHDFKHSGNNSLEAYAVTNSKASIYNELLYFTKGNNVYFSGWFYIEPVESLNGPLTLIDLESSWFNKSPGIRLITKNNALAVELEWINKKTYVQKAPIQLPQGRWFNLRGHYYLSENDEGIIEIWQDEKKIIDEHGQTLILPDAIYNSIETGITVNGPESPSAKRIYVDDFKIADKPF